jgi:hypothetical protein
MTQENILPRRRSLGFFAGRKGTRKIIYFGNLFSFFVENFIAYIFFTIFLEKCCSMNLP